MKGMRYYLSSYHPTNPSPIPGSGYLTPHRLVGNARASDVMVSATRIDTDLQTIEHLDFEPVIPCGHGQHATHHAGDEPAAYIVESICFCEVSRYPLCSEGWRLAGMRGVRCPDCGLRATRDAMMRIVEVLR